jgi:N-acetylneuraminic acid mutarotase
MPRLRRHLFFFIACLAGAGLWSRAAGAEPTWTPTGPLRTLRAEHTATLLENGKVLVAGGIDSRRRVLRSAEMFDPANGTWTPTGALKVARRRHTATLLPNGKVLVAGGLRHGKALASAEVYDPATGTWSVVDRMDDRRASHTATVLPDGRVLVVGGTDGDDRLREAEIFDPERGRWTSADDPAHRYARHGAVRLADGRVLVVGGRHAEIYDPRADRWTRARPPSALGTLTLLPDDDVLLAAKEEAEIFHPATGEWTPTAPPSVSPTSATLLPDGRVLVYDGENAETYDPTAALWTAAGSSAVARSRPTATLLPSGTVLIAGGDVASEANVPSPAEIFDASEGRSTEQASLVTPVSSPTETLLPDGRVLLVGGRTFPATEPHSRPEVFSPATGSWTVAGDLAGLLPQFPLTAGNTALLLPDGKVLDLWSPDGVCGPITPTFVFDPATDTWSPRSTMPFYSLHSRPTLLADGRVFVAGGRGDECSRIGATREAAIYDPAADGWTSVAPLPFPRAFHTSTLLPDGRVLVGGGMAVIQFLPELIVDVTASALLFDPATGSWTPTGPMNVPRFFHTATLLPNGTVLVVGGEPGLGRPVDETTAETYDPRTGVWTLTAPRSPSTGTTTLLPSGRVLLAGTSAQIYDPATRTWKDIGSLAVPRTGHAAALLLDGTVLLAGGDTKTTTETFAPAIFAAERRPVITEATASLRPGEPLVVSGTGLGGDSEASSGLTNSSAVNHPIVQLQSFETDTTVRLLPAPPNHGEKLSDETLSLAFPDVPSELPPGFYYLTVTADGITSAAVPVQVVEP